jgi:hypothetical protein
MLRSRLFILASPLALIVLAPTSALGASRVAAQGAEQHRPGQAEVLPGVGPALHDSQRSVVKAPRPSVMSSAESVTLNAPKPDAPISGGGGSCIITAIVSHNSGWSAVTGTAYTSNCVGAAVCHQTADLQTFSAVTGHVWTALKDAPQTSGCTSAHASIVSVGCTRTGSSWSYRTVGHFTVFWSSGRSTSGSVTSGGISNTFVC